MTLSKEKDREVDKPPCSRVTPFPLRGVAIVSAMVVITMVASATSWLLYGQNVAVNRLSRIVTNEQAFLLALSVEARAKELLDRDAIEGGEFKVDYYAIPKDKTHAEEWSWYFQDIAPGFPAENAEVSWCLHDLLAYMNLNNLHSEFRGVKGEKNWTRDLFSRAVYAHSEVLEDPEGLLNSLLDWFDRDDLPRSGGAENSDYQSLVPPYVVSGLRMAWPGEIKLVKGFTPEIANLFIPRLAALPDPGRITPINVNTAPAGVLRYIPGLDSATVGELIRWREESPFKSVEEFWQLALGIQQGIRDTTPPKWLKKHLDVKSYFFQASITVKLGDTTFEMQSLIVRPSKKPLGSAVLQRRVGGSQYAGCKRRKNERLSRKNELDKT